MIRRKTLFIVSTLFIASALLLGACAQEAVEEPAEAEEEPAPAEEAEEEPMEEEEAMEEEMEGEPIVVAWSGPLTGPFAEEGEIELGGFELAVEDWNARGGVLGRPIEPFICDDQVDVEMGVSCAQQAVERGAVTVSGFFFSNVGVAARPTYTQNGIIFAPSAITAPEVISTAENPELVFRTMGLASEVAGLTAQFMLENQGLRDVYVLHDRDDWGRDQAAIVDEMFNAQADAQSLGFDGITVGESEFSGIVTTIMASGADSVYFGGHHIEQAAIISQLREAGWEGAYTGPDSLKVGYPELAGDNAEGTFFCEGAGPETIPAGQDFVAAYEEAYGILPRHYSAANYVSVDLVLRGIEALGSTDDPAAIVDWIRNNSHDTVLGNGVEFDAAGEIAGFPWICAQFQGGEWVTIANYDAAAGEWVTTDAYQG